MKNNFIKENFSNHSYGKYLLYLEFENFFINTRLLIKLSNLRTYLVLKRNLDRDSSNFQTMSYVIAKKKV